MLDGIDVFRISGAGMRYLAERQNVLAQNVANADTPHFRARDLRPFVVASRLLGKTGTAAPLQLAATRAGHVGLGRDGINLVADRAASETEDPNGNTVSLEEQMVKQADVAKSYDMATTIYRRSAALFRTAAGGPFMITIGRITGAGSLTQAMATAASGMSTQGVRMRIATENMTNAGSTAATPGGDPYQRRYMTFDQRIDRATGAQLLRSGRISGDPSAFRTEYDPSHPAADERGYVKMPNISPLIEQADLREAQLSYEASVAVMQQARSLYSKTLDILKG